MSTRPRPTARPVELALDERTLLAMVADLEDMHHESLPHLRTALDDLTEDVQTQLAAERRATRRRSFLIGAGATLGGAALAACSGSSGSAPIALPTHHVPGASGSAKASGAAATTAAPATSGGTSTYAGDAKVVAMAAALENLATLAYATGLKAAGAGKLGKVPAAVGTFATTAMAQHQDHANSWNAFLSRNKLATITGTPLTVTPTLVAELGGVKDVAALARFALKLENLAVATYIGAAEDVSDKAGIATAASIAPVEAQHAAILRFVLGEYPVAASTPTSNGGATAAALTV